MFLSNKLGFVRQFPIVKMFGDVQNIHVDIELGIF